MFVDDVVYLYVYIAVIRNGFIKFSRNLADYTCLALYILRSFLGTVSRCQVRTGSRILIGFYCPPRFQLALYGLIGL
jgi:hypothetical protein